MALFSSAPNSLCILRLSAIGDVCHAVAVVQAIQHHWPTTHITWITGKVEAQLIGDLPNINVVVFDKKQGFKGMRAIWKTLQNTQFDVLLHMQAALRASLLSWGIRAPIKIGFGKNRTREGQWWFTNHHLPETEACHVLDNFAEFATYLGVPISKPAWHIPVSSSDEGYAKNNLGTQPTLIICPAASKDERNWVTERYAQLADYAVQKGLQVVLCGSPSHREQVLGQSILQHARSPIINLIGQTNLKQLTALLKLAQVVVAPDSGPAHIATTQGTPVIGLYAHSNPMRTGPYHSLDHVVSVYEAHLQEQKGLSVKDAPWGTRVKGDTLMSDISLESVMEQLDDILNQKQH